MTVTADSATADLQKLARDHLWLHFTRMGGYGDGEVPIIVRGDGCYLEDANGRRYLDALAGLFSVNIGYGYGEEVGQAALEQMRELPFYTNWSYAHPKAIELAAEVASLAPGDLNRVFFVSGGSEAVESAWKLARQYFLARGGKRMSADLGRSEADTRHDELVGAPMPRKYKAIARHIAYHGTTMGALSINGIPALRMPFEPLVPGVHHTKNTNRYHRPPDETEAEFTAMLLEHLEDTILAAGPETVCLVHMEPVQNAGGCFTPPEGYWRGVREICDRYDILLSADEVITAFGRLGYWFGSERYDIRPDIVCSAKGLSSSYAAIGAVIATERVMEPFLESTSMYAHGITFGGHPVMCAIALKNIEIMKRDGIVDGGARAPGRVPLDARAAARAADRRRPARHRVLLRDRAREGQGDACVLLRRGVRDPAPRLPLERALGGGSHLPRGRSRRPGGADLAAARRPPAGVRPDRRHARRRAGRGRSAGGDRIAPEAPTELPGVGDFERRYAELAVRVGANVQPGQKVFVLASPEHAGLVRAVTAAAWAAGARDVEPLYLDEVASFLRALNAADAELDRSPVSLLGAWTWMLDGEAVEIYLDGDSFPALWQGVDGARAARVYRPKESIPVRQRLINERRMAWTVLGAPTPGWAERVFGEPRVDRLQEAIATAVRLDRPDPVAAWRERLEELRVRCELLTERRFDAVRFRGTGHRPHGRAPRGASVARRGVRDAVGPAPLREPADGGSVHHPGPATHGGPGPDDPSRLLRRHAGRGRGAVFEGGRARLAGARSGHDFVAGELAKDDAAAFLGEVALVDGDSPIGRSDVALMHPLYDENVTSHIAYGGAYTAPIPGTDDLPSGELLSRGINDSTVHTDLPIGGPEIQVVGLDRGGAETPILDGVDWVLG